MRTLSHKFFAIGLLLTLLVCSTGRVTPVFALADPDPNFVQPVYDTEIISLTDYITRELDASNIDIFFFMTGGLALAQLGAQDALLESPFEDSNTVKEWLIDCGVQLYNTVIGLIPRGDYYVGSTVGNVNTRVKGLSREQLKFLTAQLMGNAVVAKNYPDLDTFLADPEPQLMPFQKEVQKSINAIWQIYGGPIEWQFDTQPFDFGFTWRHTQAPFQLPQAYYDYVDELGDFAVHANTYDSSVTDLVISPVGYTSFDIFIDDNTSNMYVHQVGTPTQITFAYVGMRNGSIIRGTTVCSDLSIRIQNFPTYLDAIYSVMSNPSTYRFYNFYVNNLYLCYPDYASLFSHYYAGTNWINKHEIFNVSDLNLADDVEPYYQEPEQDIFVDIRNLINDLVDTTNIWDVILHNIYDDDGNEIQAPGFIKVSVDLEPLVDLLAPALPVELNDIAEYTDNSYLDRVKEEARRGGNALAALVAFWHNCDAELIYCLFGAGITVLVGAFIGKWGHS